MARAQTSEPTPAAAPMPASTSASTPAPTPEAKPPQATHKKSRKVPTSDLWLYGKTSGPPEELWGDNDPEMQAMVEKELAKIPLLSKANDDGRLSLAVVDITNPDAIRYTFIQPDHEVFTASLSKLAVLLGVISKIRASGHPEKLEELRPQLDQMIKMSSNEDAIALFKWAGHSAIRDALYAHKLYDDDKGGLWWTLASAHKPEQLSHKEHLAICGTSRQVARYLLQMEQGRLVSPEDSRTIKDVTHNSSLVIFSQGIKKAFPHIEYYGKPGIYGTTVAEGLLIESKNVHYILVALTQGMDYQAPAFGDFGRGIHAAMEARHAPSPTPTPTPAPNPNPTAAPAPTSKPAATPTSAPTPATPAPQEHKQ
jgi:beta-lactamase class A